MHEASYEALQQAGQVHTSLSTRRICTCYLSCGIEGPDRHDRVLHLQVQKSKRVCNCTLKIVHHAAVAASYMADGG